jgi:pimeloyl-ACP methyl ester carboxylesterase
MFLTISCHNFVYGVCGWVGGGGSWHTGTVPAKVLLQLTTAFRDGGLRNRTGTFFFKEHLNKIKVPVLALAGDEDLICPPEAVYGLATSSISPLFFCNKESSFL